MPIIEYISLSKWWAKQNKAVQASFIIISLFLILFFTLRVLYGNLIDELAVCKADNEKKDEYYKAREAAWASERVIKDQQILNVLTEKNVFIKNQADDFKRKNDELTKKVDTLYSKLIKLQNK